MLRIGCAVLDACHDYLRPKRKPQEMFEIYAEMSRSGYAMFSAEELLDALTRDPRFVVQTSGSPRMAQVRVRRERESRTRG